MTFYLTPEQASALHAGGNAPMQLVDPQTQRVYYVIDSSFLAELEQHANLEAIREGVDDIRAGRTLPIDDARIADRAALLARLRR
jgi:hypothetical protein